MRRVSQNGPRARDSYVCDNCGNADGLNKWSQSCPNCAERGTIKKVSAQTAKGARSERKALAPDQQAVVEILAKASGASRREVTDAVERAFDEGHDPVRIRAAAEDTVKRHEKVPLERPVGFFLSQTRRRRVSSKEKVSAQHQSGWEELQQPHSGGNGAPTRLSEHLEARLADQAAAATAKPKKRPKRRAKDAPPTFRDVTGMTLQEMMTTGDPQLAMARVVEYERKYGPLAPPPPDDDEPDCATCLDARFLTVRTTLRDPNFGKVEECPNCVDDFKPERILRIIKASGLADAPVLRLEDLEITDALRPAHEAIEAFIAGDVQQVVLAGLQGRGKTHLMIGALVRIIEQGEWAYYLNLARFLDELRGTYDDRVETTFLELMTIVQRVPVLAIDDVGAEQRTEWAIEKVYQLVDARYATGLRTMAATNYEPEVWDDRVRSRLCDRQRSAVVYIPATVPDYRLGR